MGSSHDLITATAAAAADPALAAAAANTAPPQLLAATRLLRWSARGRGDRGPRAGDVSYAVPGPKRRAAGWGIVVADAITHQTGGPDGQWVTDLDVRPPETDGEIAACADAMARHWIREAQAVLDCPVDDDRDLGRRDVENARLRGLIADINAHLD